ncbi:hypothetical protein [Roseovarius albus]|uniref:hypothetical protein n=1 Tax=Roseovarius albus TaxID=1247867 RepID=UPI000A272880|nr:hypothetical protein [Roseovarius albus]
MKPRLSGGVLLFNMVKVDASELEVAKQTTQGINKLFRIIAQKTDRKHSTHSGSAEVSRPAQRLLFQCIPTCTLTT